MQCSEERYCTREGAPVSLLRICHPGGTGSFTNMVGSAHLTYLSQPDSASVPDTQGAWETQMKD